MANPYSKCRECGNMWPPKQVHDHPVNLTNPLKKKYRVRKGGWDKPASPRTNNTWGGKYLHLTQGIGPRKRAYGPFFKVKES